MIIKIAKVCFWCSVAMGMLGLIISFYPGAECPWFAIAAILAIPGFLIPKRIFRIGSFGILILWSIVSLGGYTRGKEYQQSLKENPIEDRIRELEKQTTLMESNNTAKGLEPSTFGSTGLTSCFVSVCE
jgi:hypothetical protein